MEVNADAVKLQASSFNVQQALTTLALLSQLYFRVTYVKSSRSILNALDSPKLGWSYGGRKRHTCLIIPFHATQIPLVLPRPTLFSIIIAMENDAVTMEAER